MSTSTPGNTPATNAAPGAAPSGGGVDTSAANESVDLFEVDATARMLTMLGTLAAIALSIHQLFNIKLFGLVLLEGQYLYILGGLFLSITFLCFRLSLKRGGKVPWYDWLLAVLALVVAGYFAATAETSLDSGWEYAPPDTARYFSFLFYALILEGARRTGGWVIFFFVLAFSLYPTFAAQMPGPISGFSQPLADVLPYHIISSESSFGIPMKAFGSLVIGFILFGAVLQRTGGGQFFNDLALSMVGGYRGGAAKVAIFASGFMGSMSGSVISNVLTTGAVSIPAMKKTGFEPRYAGATEACASTGGVLMPPIMGATAFVMASFLSMPYIEIALAAAIPSVLYYFGLFAQIDAYSARRGLKGLAKADVPSFKTAMATGWPYILVFALLIFMMVVLRQETLAPFYSVALLLVINQLFKRFRFTMRAAGDMIVGVGQALAELTAVLLGIGLIVGSFSATGLAGTLVNDLVFLAGDNTLVLLMMGAITAFIFGMGMTVTACYIFLAIVLAPALEQAGLNVVAVHLFILYWGMVSFITPPVALGAFAAATMAGASPMATAWQAMKLGGVIYLAPFFFVLNPALVGQAPAGEVFVVCLTAFFGVFLLSAAIQGWVSMLGELSNPVLRLLLFAAGLMFAAPANDAMGLSHLQMSGLGLLLAILPLFMAWKAGKAQDAREAAVAA